MKRLIHELREQNPKLAAKADGGSAKAAISLFCRECYGGDPGVKDAIRACTAPNCPLYPFRPYKRVGEQAPWQVGKIKKELPPEQREALKETLRKAREAKKETKGG